jgi:iron(III) transport system substrate-binding protein
LVIWALISGGSFSYFSWVFFSPRALAVSTLLLVAMAAACGDDDSDGGPEPVAGPADVPAVLAELEGLDPDARRERLVELVEAEGSAVSFYTSMSVDNAEALTAAFEEEFDIEVALFRADSESIAQRVREEIAAGVKGADLVEAGAQPMQSLDPSGFADYTSPYIETLIEGADNGHWVTDQLSLFALSWNTDAVVDAERPTEWEDLADPRWKDRLVMEVDDAEWYAVLYKYWLDQGKTPAEADRLFQAMADNARFVKGHSLMAQLLASGEFDVAGSNFVNRVQFLQKQGAPVAFEPVVEPLIATFSGVGILANNAHPAAAVLFADWLLGDAQGLFAELDIVPARADLQPGGDAQIVLPDLDELTEDFAEWAARYAALVGDEEVIEDDS